MSKFRVSYSLLDTWERGKPDDVIDMYFKLGLRQPTKAMEDGKRIHEEIEDHITMYNCFPTYLFEGGLTLPEPEKKLEVSYNDMFDLVGVIDCIDYVSKTMYEFKTGVQNSTDYARSHQIPLYFLLCDMSYIEVEKAYIIHYNQHTDNKDFTIVWNGKDKLDQARNYVDSVAPEIYYFFQSEGLI